MDDYIRPSQAAKVRAAHGKRALKSDSKSLHSVTSSDCESEAETKRQKMAGPPVSRSFRAINHNIIYSTNIHPQDAVLAQMDYDVVEDELVTGDDASSDVFSGASHIYGSEDDDSVEQNFQDDENMEMVQETDENTSQSDQKTVGAEGNDANLDIDG